MVWSHNQLTFLLEKIVGNKFEKLIYNLNDEKDYAVQIKHLQEALNHGIKLTKYHKAIKFTQEKWLKPYINLNIQLRTKVKKSLGKTFTN